MISDINLKILDTTNEGINKYINKDIKPLTDLAARPNYRIKLGSFVTPQLNEYKKKWNLGQKKKENTQPEDSPDGYPLSANLLKLKIEKLNMLNDLHEKSKRGIQMSEK